MYPTTALLVSLLAILSVACSRTEHAAPKSKTCSAKFDVTDETDIRAVLPTDSGMHGIWDPHTFAGLCSFETWEKKFVENRDIEVSIKAGSFVPIYVHSDGSPLIHVRVARNDARVALLPSETQYVRKQSDEYLFVSHGLLAVSGIEYIGGMLPESSKIMAVANGRWSVRVIELAAPHGTNGKPLPEIADFVVLVNPEPSPPPSFRQSVETFR